MVILPRTFSSGHVVCGAYIRVCTVCACVCWAYNVQPGTVCVCEIIIIIIVMAVCPRAQRLFCMEIDCTVYHYTLDGYIHRHCRHLHLHHHRRPTDHRFSSTTVPILLPLLCEMCEHKCVCLFVCLLLLTCKSGPTKRFNYNIILYR